MYDQTCAVLNQTRSWSVTISEETKSAFLWDDADHLILDHKDHGASREPINPFPEWVHRLI